MRYSIKYLSEACILHPERARCRVPVGANRTPAKFMSKSMKAALFSALVFPGSGHLYLKRYVVGFLLVVVSVVALYVLVSTALEVAQVVSAEMLNGDIPLDTESISEEISRQEASKGSPLAAISSYLLLFCWLGGIVDSFRLGRLEDRRDQTREDEN